MAKIELQKVVFVGLKKHASLLLKELQKREDVHLVSSSEEKKALPSEETAKTNFLLRALEPFAAKVSALRGEWVLTEKDEAEARVSGLREEVLSYAEQVDALDLESAHASARLKEIDTKIAELEPYVSYSGQLGSAEVSASAVMFLGQLPKAQFTTFQEELDHKTPLAEVIWSSAGKQNASFALVVHKNVKEIIEKKLQSVGFARSGFLSGNEYKGQTISQILADLESEKQNLLQKEEASSQEKQRMAEKYEDLKLFSDVQSWKDELAESEKNIETGDFAFNFEAFLPARSVKSTEKWLKNAFVGEVSLEKVSLNEDESMPAMMENGTFVRPYEIITEMYGVPAGKDIDPTPSLSPFFLVFFGICLSDVGYGAMLLLLGAIFLLFGTLSSAQKDMYRLIFMCGVSATIGGVLLGGWFGLTPEQAPSLLLRADGTFVGSILNPIEGSGPLDFLVFSLYVGVVQLLSGFLVEAYKFVKQGKYENAIFDSLIWFVFLVCLCGFALADQFGLPKPFFQTATLVSGALLVLFQGREAFKEIPSQKNPIMYPVLVIKGLFSGLLGLYGVMNYISVILSYSRLMALGLATGVIAFAMNKTAGVLFEMVGVPVVAHLVAAVVLIFGHGLNFGLSLLGASIHSMRLQFIEFFGRFYEGGGEKFSPLSRKSRFILPRS